MSLHLTPKGIPDYTDERDEMFILWIDKTKERFTNHIHIPKKKGVVHVCCSDTCIFLPEKNLEWSATFLEKKNYDAFAFPYPSVCLRYIVNGFTTKIKMSEIAESFEYHPTTKTPVYLNSVLERVSLDFGVYYLDPNPLFHKIMFPNNVFVGDVAIRMGCPEDAIFCKSEFYELWKHDYHNIIPFSELKNESDTSTHESLDITGFDVKKCDNWGIAIRKVKHAKVIAGKLVPLSTFTFVLKHVSREVYVDIELEPEITENDMHAFEKVESTLESQVEANLMAESIVYPKEIDQNAYDTQIALWVENILRVRSQL